MYLFIGGEINLTERICMYVCYTCNPLIYHFSFSNALESKRQLYFIAQD